MTETTAPCKRRHVDPEAAAAHRAQTIRRDDLACALQAIEGGSPTEYVNAADAFEEYLTGGKPGTGITPEQISKVESALEDAENTLAMIDAPEVVENIREALALLSTIASA